MVGTHTTKAAPRIGAALTRNIKGLEERRRAKATRATRDERIAGAITHFTGSMAYVYLHLALSGGWIAVNLELVPGVSRFDGSLVMLAMVASVEAIFLSTFVLISQNRMSAEATGRAELDLQISLVTEHELTHLAKLLAEVTAAIAPEAVIDAIAAEQANSHG